MATTRACRVHNPNAVMSTQEAARVALRERQLKEQKYAHLNSIKIHNQWRKIMRMAKVEELRRDIEILSQNHEREVDRKDAIVQMLDRDLEEAEEQYNLAVRGHMMIMDRLLDLQFQRMKALEAQFDADLQASANASCIPGDTDRLFCKMNRSARRR